MDHVKAVQICVDDISEIIDSTNSCKLSMLDTDHHAIVTELHNEDGFFEGTILYVPGRTFSELLNV